MKIKLNEEAKKNLDGIGQSYETMLTHLCCDERVVDGSTFTTSETLREVQVLTTLGLYN